MENTELSPKQEIRSLVEKEVAAIMAFGSKITITTQSELENSVNLTREIKRVGALLEEKRTELVGPLNAKVKEINAYFKVPACQLEETEKKLKTAASTYQAEVERKRAEEQRKAEEAARRERERIEREAAEQRRKEEAARQAEEDARRRQEEARVAAEEAARRGDKEAAEKAEAERRAAEVEANRKAREAAGAAEKATVKETVAVSVVAAPVQTQSSKVKGFSTRTEYEPVIADNPTAKAAAIAGIIKSGNLHIIQIDMGALKKLGNATKGNAMIDGVTWKQSTVAAVR